MCFVKYAIALYNIIVLNFIVGSFGQFDYGPVLNLQHYNSTEPPTYNLKSINVPITLIYGKNDILADEKVSVHDFLQTC